MDLSFNSPTSSTARTVEVGPAIAGPIASRRKSPPPPPPPETPNAIKEFYAPAQGKEGAALLTSLQALSATGQKVRTYENARSMMFKVIEDLDGDDVVTDVYSGAKVTGVSGLTTATRKGLTAEHVWPQSEGATEAARSDMFILRPVFQSLNSHRSNLPYGEVMNPDWASEPVKGVQELSMVGIDESGTKVFMPRASMRGDLARDQFYFYTRYSGGGDRPAGYSNRNFLHSLKSLLKWSAEDPVDAAERARNDAIARLQGNRNPYVDRPEFVDAVGFTEALVKRRS